MSLPSRFFSGMPHLKVPYAATSRPVWIASTPGILAASVASMPRSTPCAYGMRTITAWAWPGSEMSSQ